MLVGCSGEAKFPEDSSSVYCTNIVDDCDEQLAERCPAGYTVLRKENWSSQLAPQMRGGGRAAPVRHTSLRILCAEPAKPAA